ncbi:MAG: hypothetical protein EOO40_07115, partial [Deltaproteobacteria bacterium]
MPVDPQLLFGRAYSVTLVAPNGTIEAQYGNMGTGGTGLRVAFDVERTVADAGNTAKIALFNLSPGNRAAIGKGYRVQLVAGYVGLAEKIFIGTVSKSIVQRQGADIITNIEALDGQQGLFSASFNQDFPPDTRLCDVLSLVSGGKSWLKLAENSP